MHSLADPVLAVLDELIVGPADPAWVWVISAPAGGPASSLLGTAAGLTAAQASAHPAGVKNSIAAHLNHIRFGLANAHAWLTDPPPPPELQDWDGSWSVQSVDDTQWQKLQADTRATYEKLRAAIQAAERTLSEGDAGPARIGAVAAPAHVAYHLGAIRQLVRMIDDARSPHSPGADDSR